MVEQITSMEEDFAQWYTDVVLKRRADRLYQRKGLYGDQTSRLCDLGADPEAARRDLKRQGYRMYICSMFIPESLLEKKRIM